jgi:hypothetical protein
VLRKFKSSKLQASFACDIFLMFRIVILLTLAFGKNSNEFCDKWEKMISESSDISLSFQTSLLPSITTELTEPDFLCFFEIAVANGLDNTLGLDLFQALAPIKSKQTFTFDAKMFHKTFVTILNVLCDEIADSYETFKDLYILWSQLKDETGFARLSSVAILKKLIHHQEIWKKRKYLGFLKLFKTDKSISSFNSNEFNKHKDETRSIFTTVRNLTKINDFHLSMYLIASEYLNLDFVNELNPYISQYLVHRKYPDLLSGQIDTIRFMQSYRNPDNWKYPIPLATYESARQQVVQHILLDKLIEPATMWYSQSEQPWSKSPGEDLLLFTVNTILKEPTIVESVYYHFKSSNRRELVDIEYFKIMHSALWIYENKYFMHTLQQIYKNFIGDYPQSKTIAVIMKPDDYEAIVQTASLIYWWYLNPTRKSPFKKTEEDFLYLKIDERLREKLVKVYGLLQSGQTNSPSTVKKKVNSSGKRSADGAKEHGKSKQTMIVVACAIAGITMISVGWIFYRSIIA